MHLRRHALLAAIAAAAIPALAHAQVVLNDNFDDGLAASRWTFNNLNSATASYAPHVDFAYNYSQFQYDNYLSGVAVPTPIPPAPGGTSTIGVRLKLDPVSPAPTGGSALIAEAIIPNGVTVNGDFRLEGVVWSNYNGGPGDEFASQGGTGSTEYWSIGLNRTGTTGVTGFGPTGAVPASGYVFGGALEGGSSSDWRIHTNDAGDDGPGYSKRNATWPGAHPEYRYNLTTGDLILAPTTAVGDLVIDNPDNHANSYYRSEVFPKSAGYEVPGAPAKQWVPFVVEQRGRITTFTLNGKIIATLYNNDATHSGAPQFGYFDRIAGVANPDASEFAIFDNLKATQLTAAPVNTISPTDNYAVFNASATSNGAASVSGLTFDSPAPVTVDGTGTLTFTGATGTIVSGGANHVITKPVEVSAPMSFQIAQGTSLAIAHFNNSAGKLLTKTERGELDVDRITNGGLSINDGKVVLTGVGANKLTSLNIGSSAGYAAESFLDFKKNVIAVDYVQRNSLNPVKSNSPLSAGGLAARNTLSIIELLNSGYGGGTWTGAGLMNSEILGAGPDFAIRVSEASALGYGNGATWAGGLTIDASTVLFGFTFAADTNLDQTINFSDLLTLAQNYSATGLDPLSSWGKGDSNSDGNVDFTDLLALAQKYGQTVNGAPAGGSPTGSFEGDWALAQSMVPEPTSLMAIGLGAASLLRRRRRGR